MPLPAGLLAALATAGAFTSVLGSAADYASLAFTITDHVKAQEGLKYKADAFSVDFKALPEPGRQPSSAASAGQSGGKSAAQRPRKYRIDAISPEVPLLTIRGTGAFAPSFAKFGAVPYGIQNPDGSRRTVYVVHLSGIRGFATEVGDQAEVEFSGHSVEGGYLLSAKGIVNELFAGFFHFWCDFLIPSPSDDVNDVFAMESGLVGAGGKITTRGNQFVIEF